MSATTLNRLSLAGALLLAVGCTEASTFTIGTKLENESCKQVSDCKAGLDCVEGVCTALPPLTTGPQRGDPCTGDSQCAPDLICGRQGVCTTGPLLDLGAMCALTLQCKVPLICNGATGVCGPDDGSAGTLTLGDDCVNITDCQRPFICGFDNKCDKPPFLAGANCSLSNAEMGAFRVYWEIPPVVDKTAVPADYEFDRLPFPNDMRFVCKNASGVPVDCSTAGASTKALALDGMSAPGEVLGIDIAGTYYKAVQEDGPGFALNQPVFFRFSDIVDTTSVCLDATSVYPTPADPEAPGFCTGGGAATVYLVNIDPGSAGYGDHVPVQMNMSKDGGMYICQNWLGLAPKDGEPLEPSTTYAAVITMGVKDLRGAAPIRDKDFESLMADTVPQERQFQVKAMQPLMDWITAKGIDAATIAGATVFTTAEPTAVAAQLRTAIQELPPPAFDKLTPTGSHPVVCDGVNISPCDDRASHVRGCSWSSGAIDPHPEYFEIQGTYQNPVFQAGTRPYLRPEDGGAFVYSSAKPQKQKDETMCFAVAVPKTAMPTNGFPVIIFEHGTGGDYRSFINDGLATELVAQGYAVIGIDNVMHGWRNWPASPPAATLPLPASPAPIFEADPGRLFFNLVNPRASRDNILQGAADAFYLTRLVKLTTNTLTAPAPTNTFHFDGTRIYYIGHSQGTVISPPYIMAEPDLKAAVLSGAGADLALSILNKKEPADVSLAAAAVFADQTLGRIHPMMGIIAMLFSPADSISYAPLWVTNHPERGPLPLLHISGIGDSYCPDVTQWAQMRAAHMPIVGTPDLAVAGVSTVASPAQNNLNGVTAGVAQFTPTGGEDGHFVMYEEAAAKATLEHFFSSANSGSPQITR